MNKRGRSQTLKWKLDDIYDTEERWEADYAGAGGSARFLRQSADALYAALCDESSIWQLVERVYTYAHLHKDEDEDNGSATAIRA